MIMQAGSGLYSATWSCDLIPMSIDTFDWTADSVSDVCLQCLSGLSIL